MSNEKLPQRDEYQDGTVYGQEVLNQLDGQEEVASKNEEIQAQAAADREEYARDERVTAITEQLNKINKAVQQSTVLGSEFGNEFGVDFKHNKAEAQKWIEDTVLKLEESLRTIQKEQAAAENAKRHAKTIEQLNKINKAVQQSTFLGSEFGNEFGVDFKHNKAEAQKWIEKKVAELEASMRPEVPESGDTTSPEKTPADAYWDAEMVELKRQAEGNTAVPEEAPAELPQNENEPPTETVEEPRTATLETNIPDAPTTETETEAMPMNEEPQRLTKPEEGEIRDVTPIEEVVSTTTQEKENAPSLEDIENEIQYLKRINAGGAYISDEFQNRYPAFRDIFKGGSKDAAAYNWIQNKLIELRLKRQELLEGGAEGNRNPETTPINAEGAGVVREAYNANVESEEKRSKWGWLKERFKGLGTIGYWEVHQAERFRAGTKEVGRDINTKAEVLEQTGVLDLDAAHDEANRMLRETAEIRSDANKSAEEIRERLTEVSDTITAEKGAYNEKVAERIVTQARAEVMEKLAKYKNEYGDGVLGKERLAQFEAGLKKALLDSTEGVQTKTGTLLKQEKNFTQTVRERLDPKYWRRYVYGGVEAALMLIGFKVAVTKLLAEGATAGVAKVGVGAEQLLGGDVPMKDTIWNTSKEWLMQHGVSNPTNEQLMSISKQVAIDNHIGVAEWGIPGSPMDVGMQQGHLLNYKGAANLLMKGI